MITRSKREAKAKIKGKTFAMFFTVFLITLFVSGIITFLTYIGLLAVEGKLGELGVRDFFTLIMESFNSNVIQDIIGSTSIWFVFANFLLGFLFYPLSVGDKLYHLNAARDGSESAKDLFRPYKNMFKISIAMYGYSLLVSIGLILFLIPGIYFALKYALLPFVLLDNPELSVGEAFGQAGKLSKGHKGDIFFLYISFIGWFILIPFTLFIALIYVSPYLSTSFARLYINIKEEKEPAPILESVLEQQGPQEQTRYYHYPY